MTVLLNKREAAARIGVNPHTLVRMAREGRFPVPVRVSDYTLAEFRFVESEVEEWIASRIAKRDEMAADDTPKPTKPGRGRPKGSKNKTTATEKPRHTKRKGHPSYPEQPHTQHAASIFLQLLYYLLYRELQQ